MSIVIELSDRALALARGGELLDASAAVVRLVGSAQGPAGQSMLGRERITPTEVADDHWSQIAEGAADGGAALQTARAELLARLQRFAIAEGSTAEVLATAPFDAPALSAVLALLRADGLRVTAFRDAAVVTAAALDLPGDALVLELGQHHVAVTRIARQGEEFVRRGQRVSREQGGLIELRQQWLALAAEALVLRTRFDPLHDAHTEQALYDALPRALAVAAAAGRSLLSARGPAGEPLAVELTRDQLALPVQPFMRGTAALLHALRPAAAALTLIVPAALASLPGVNELLMEFSGCELLTLPDGFAATALSAALASGAVQPEAVSGDDTVRLWRRCPVLRSAEAAALPGPQRRRIGSDTELTMPTHMLHAGRALPIGAQPLEIGRAATGEPRVLFPEGLAGVSRLHCTLRREGDQVLLIDHSRHGSFVNGERVAGRALLHAGDRLRVGDPGIEMALITVGETHASPPAN